MLVALVGLAVLSYRFPLFTNTLYVASPVYNFNVATTGDEINARFVVRNLHPWSVTLTDIKSSCGCPQPIADRPLPVKIALFEAVVIRTTFDASGRVGNAHQPVRLITSDIPHGMELLIKGHVFPERKRTP
jgi:hypothetical protein